MDDVKDLTVSQEIGGWIVQMSWSSDEVQGGPSMLVIKPKDPDNVPVGGVSSTVLRDVDFRSAAASVRELVADQLGRMPLRPGRIAMPLLRAMLNAGGLTDEYLVMLSIEYLSRVELGEQKPVEHIAQELGKSPGTIKGHLWQARNRELLLGGSAGRKGGYIPLPALKIAEDFMDEFGDALGDDPLKSES